MHSLGFGQYALAVVVVLLASIKALIFYGLMPTQLKSEGEMTRVRNLLKNLTLQDIYAKVSTWPSTVVLFCRRLFALAQNGSKQLGLLLGRASFNYVTWMINRLPKTQELWAPILTLEVPVADHEGSPHGARFPNPRYERIRIASELVSVVLAVVAGWYTINPVASAVYGLEVRIGCPIPGPGRLLGLVVGILITYLAARTLLYGIQCGQIRFIAIAVGSIFTLVVPGLYLWLGGRSSGTALVSFWGAWPAISAYMLPLLLLAWRKFVRLAVRLTGAALRKGDELADRWLPEPKRAPPPKRKRTAHVEPVSITSTAITSVVLLTIAWVILPMQSMPWWLAALIVLMSQSVYRALSRRPFLMLWGNLTERLMLNPLPLDD